MKFVWSVIALTLFSIFVSAQSDQMVRSLALMHVTVIDGTGAPPKRDMTVIMVGYRIADIVASGSIKNPRFAQTIDATGSFLIPGLWDMHAHPDDPELWPSKPEKQEKEKLLTLLISNGVTGIRDMGGDLKLLQEWRSRIANNSLVGPHIQACGPLLDGPKPMWPGSLAISTPEQGRDAVRDLKRQHADFIKVYSLLPRDAYFAIADEAKKLKIPFAGHVPDSVTPAEASDAGQASEEHLLQIVQACSDVEAIAKKMNDLRESGASPEQRRRAYIDALLASFDYSKAEALYAKFVTNNTWITPTLIVWQNNAAFEDEMPKYSERMKYLPRYIREYWDPKNNAHLKNRSPERLAAEKLLIKKYLEIVGAMNKAGVKLLAGSDFGANPVFPGWGVHDEMALLVKAGLKPIEAIQAATSNPAVFLGLDKSVGTIEKNKLADMVLLSANPLDDINNTRKISAVIFQGKMYDRASLNRMLGALIAQPGAKQ